MSNTDNSKLSVTAAQTAAKKGLQAAKNRKGMSMERSQAADAAAKEEMEERRTTALESLAAAALRSAIANERAAVAAESASVDAEAIVEEVRRLADASATLVGHYETVVSEIDGTSVSTLIRYSMTRCWRRR